MVAEGHYRGDELLAAAEKMRPEQRLVLPVESRPDDEILPQRSLDPPAMLLRPAEIEEMFAGADGKQVAELARLSDGWIGPLAWLRERRGSGELPQSGEFPQRGTSGEFPQRGTSGEFPQRGTSGTMPDIALNTTDFTNRFQQRVVSRIDRRIFEAMIECSLVEELDARLWRRLWIDRPEKLAALERLLCEGGWVISEQGTARLPRLVRRAARSRCAPERRREIYRQLGLAAHGLGLAAEAERYLRRAGDAARLCRMRAVGMPATAATATATATAATGGGSPLAGNRSSACPRFELHLLGQAMVRRIDASGEERELEWRLQRAFQSVAFLALAADHRATKEQLVDAVWRDAKASSVTKNFHPTMSEARRTIHREVFAYSQGRYTLNPDLGWWIDCDRFRQLSEHGRRLSAGSASELEHALDAWLAAWKLYRGELLSGMEAAWISGHRQALHRDYIELLRGIGGLCARFDRVTQALDAYRSLLLKEPFEERIHLEVMELYARRGRRDLVRRQFVRMRELLVEELNVEPAEETQDRYHQQMR